MATFNSLKRASFIKNILQTTSSKTLSIEISPSISIERDFFESLNVIGPRFVSVTWLGNDFLSLPTDEIPAITIARQLCEKGFDVLLHLAGRNVDAERMLDLLACAKQAGIRNILALQGDWKHVLERDDAKCDFPHASDLVKFIKDNFRDDFCIGVAGYPHGHPHSRSVDEDMRHLKLKVSTGADFIITQAAFSYEILKSFARTCRKHDIRVPILMGIFIIKSYANLLEVEKYCEFKICKEVYEFVEEHKNDKEIIENYGFKVATELIQNSLRDPELFSGAHIYCMNNLMSVRKLIKSL